MKKFCKKCHKDKPTTEFYCDSKSSDGLQHVCKLCDNKRRAERNAARKIEAINYKGGCCFRCNWNEYAGALEFHHRDPTKKDIDWKKIRKYKFSNIKKELDKCDLLCANCHRVVHHEMYLKKLHL